MERRATITDVAAHAGVSRTTVSLVLAGADRIPDVTKARVRGAMEELGYVYNRAAQAARVGRSNLIGLLLTDIRNPFFAELTMAVDRVADEHGLSVIQAYSYGDPKREARMARTLAENVLGGLILLPTPRSETSRLLPVASGQPLVQLLRRVPGLESDFVGVDNVASGAELGRHLAKRDPERVMLVGEYASVQFLDRQAGLSAGLGRPVEAVVGGAAGFAAALTSGVPDAVVTYNDTHLLAVLHVLRDLGLRPGVQVAVASFDNTHIAVDTAPGITSMDHHAGRLAELAAQRVLARIDDSDAPLESLLVPPALIVRESTLCP